MLRLEVTIYRLSLVVEVVEGEVERVRSPGVSLALMITFG